MTVRSSEIQHFRFLLTHCCLPPLPHPDSSSAAADLNVAADLDAAATADAAASASNLISFLSPHPNLVSSFSLTQPSLRSRRPPLCHSPTSTVSNTLQNPNFAVPSKRRPPQCSFEFLGVTSSSFEDLVQILALNEALSAEVQRLKIATGELTPDSQSKSFGRKLFANPSMFQLQQQQQQRPPHDRNNFHSLQHPKPSNDSPQTTPQNSSVTKNDSNDANQ